MMMDEVDHDVFYPKEKIGKVISDRDGWVRIIGQSHALIDHGPWQDIPDARALRNMKINRISAFESTIIVNTRGQAAYVHNFG